jgi:hypothetical protein
MSYQGKKVWLFRVIPLSFSANQAHWSVDVRNPALNKAADVLATAALSLCAALSIPVTLTPRLSPALVKNRSASKLCKDGFVL